MKYESSIYTLDALEASLESLPDWAPEQLSLDGTIVFSIDMNNGFARKGPLSSERVANMIPATSRFLARCKDLNLPIVAVTDSHQPGAAEFSSYPPHCLINSEESELVDEIKAYPDQVLYKNSTNAFFSPGMEKLLHGLRTAVVTGCCTDICIEQFACTLKAAFNEKNEPLEVILPRQLTETFDGPGHDGALMGSTALSSMLGNSIRVVNLLDEPVRKEVQ